MEKIIYPPWISKKMKVRFDNLLLCIDASGFIHSCRSYDKSWDFQTRAIWLRINGMGPYEICKMLDLNVATIKHREFLGLFTLNYNNKNYKLRKVIRSVEERKKREEMSGNPKWREECSLRMKEIVCTPEWIKNQKNGAKRRSQKPKWIKSRKLIAEKIRNDPNYGKRISAGLQHIPYEKWESFASDSPYCPAFNDECRESNREKYNRKCFICNLLEKNNITSTGKWQRLSVHHVDMDKGQGCDNKRWKLVPVCIKHHGLLHTELWMFRIIWLLDNVWCSDE